jgi:hypothetical protein
MTAGTLSGTGLISDPTTSWFGATPAISGTGFSINPSPDGANPGRYSPSTLGITVGAGTSDYTTVIYQASGDQLV